MSGEENNWVDIVRTIRPHQAGGQRAPYKTLLLLWMIARTIAGKSPVVSYKDAEPQLKRLMWSYRMGRTLSVKYPFVYLADSSTLWQIRDSNGNDIYQMTRPIYPNKSQPGRESVKFLRKEATGSLTSQFLDAIRNATMRSEIVNELLRLQFPESLHNVILRDLNLDHAISYKSPPRDPDFREAVLEAYRETCSFCGFDSRLRDNAVGIDAAHIMMRSRGGADTLDNGLALCVLHHRLFDRGALGLSDHRLVLLSPLLTGMSASSRQQVNSLASREITHPLPDCDLPHIENIRWHRNEIFIGR